jgi:hypothetical protein
MTDRLREQIAGRLRGAPRSVPIESLRLAQGGALVPGGV